jgi:poly(3-hydroxybutyrate) depolymerase
LALAKKHNFALLLPQQSLSNNIKRCFNWYSADYFTRDLAGGAMASGMLANYPALFTGGGYSFSLRRGFNDWHFVYEKRSFTNC